jgi:undecaprenyl diphosphate synthase
VPRDRRPRHVAVIMDGNGRWAQRRHLPRIEGHRRGVASVRRTVEEAARLHLDQLTLYCLSSENWKRPQRELDFLMHLLEQYMIEERTTIMRQNVAVRVIGRRDGIPPATLAEMDKTIQLSAANTGTRLCLAINYGGRAEIVDAVRRIADEARRGTLDPARIDEQSISDRLYTAGMPDPDLLIRTAGEMRISNFLLWQISYAELWVTDRCWPEFEIADFHQAIRDYAARDRKYGGIK